ncbi:MAG: apolipoprotein N-acyltransferase [Gammaproteobacteria bacterium]|nr:apolipoprotein N-acyltransferase [Gammaproteobacteria bacterium]
MINFTKLFQRGWPGDLLAFLAGSLMVLSFAPFSVAPIAILSLACLAALWLRVPTKTAAWRGWLFGLGLFGFGIYWIFNSIHDIGGVNIPISLFLSGIFIACMALFPAFAGFLLGRYFSKDETIKLTLGFPAVWVFVEWIRSWIFTGFPWLTIGYSQMHSPLRGYAPLLGVFGVSLFVAYSSVFLIKIIQAIHAKKYRQGYGQLFLLIALWTTGSALTLVTWTQPFGKPVTVSLVQGNIPEKLKWTADMIQPTLNTYSKLSAPLWKNNIVIWPESAVPISLQDAENFMNEQDALAKKNHSTFITGIPVNVENNYYNAVVALGDGHGFYLKHRLVPFGEYIPFKSIFQRAFDFLKIPMTDFIADHKPAVPIVAGQLKLLTFICYEIAFPEQVNFRNPDINLLLTVSNDAWFGRSTAQAQHLEMASMRALETGRPILFASNTGITAIADAKGNIQSQVPAFSRTVLTDTVQPTQGKTPWQRKGMDSVLLTIFGAMITAWWRQRKISASS